MIQKKIFASILFVLTSMITVAQGSVPPAPQGPPPIGLPIDGGVVFLLVLGALYGTYKLIKSKKLKA
ncbi:PID-CTERM protein-sorting domain-containing protein [Lacinutrix salivirga]